MVGATGLGPATPITPFDTRYFSQRPVFPYLIVFPYLSTHIDFTRFKENDKCGEMDDKIEAPKRNGNS
jgi:hypothetical protein